ncbi:HAD-IIA family hydrolase [Halobacillus salinarum]|uniref:HAD-IIA family hydrolase n=1 Tax=Halobacillus salinarum TaxID=2932257 RepID=A0ABY4EGK6_9BACI|nr:HAD-IIA family hydrolase [Halobacillus salinarum]UOQ43198.1 HAD-IIA family hydrolase [Halobacillus salinarum]
MNRYDELHGFLIDLDGTVWKGAHIVAGAAETIRTLKEDGKRVLGLSNRGTHSRKGISHFLKEHGIDLPPEDLILSSYVAADFLASRYKKQKVWVLGEEGLVEELKENGVPIADHPKEAKWLVVSLHTKLGYEDLNHAFQAVTHGARIIATNKDKTYPGPSGLSIDVAGMLGAIEASTGARADIIVGKPSHYMFDKAMLKIGCEARETIIIGDSLTSDIAMGELFSISTGLVLTGNTTLKMTEDSIYKPDFVMDSIRDVRQKLQLMKGLNPLKPRK